MPALSAPFLGFALGAGLCWSVARHLARPVRPLASHALVIVAAFGLLAFAPSVALTLGAEPDWCLSYWLPAERLPRWLPALWTLTAGVSVPLGFALGERAARGRSRAFPQRWVWGPLALGAGPLLLSVPRLAARASYAQYHGDYAVQAVTGGPLGYFLLALATGVALATWLTRRALVFLAQGATDGA
jgi:hypothetical protein